MGFDLNELGEGLKVKEEHRNMKGKTTEEEHGPKMGW